MLIASRHQRGFSPIELMVGLVAGLIVIGAVSSFAVTTLRASNQNLQSSRLTQDLRTTMTLVTRELRRSGYDEKAVSKLGSGAPLSSFTTLAAPPFGAAGCVSYQYNRSGNQYRAIRANGGALEMATSNAEIGGCAAASWSPISDTDVVTITGFVPNEVRDAFASIIQSNVVGSDTEVLAGCGVVRNISLDITGSLATDASISRTIHEEVRVRADPLLFVKKTFTGSGSAVPSPEQECEVMNECLAPYGQTAPDCP